MTPTILNEPVQAGFLCALSLHNFTMLELFENIGLCRGLSNIKKNQTDMSKLIIKCGKCFV